MIQTVKKRDGRIVGFNEQKVMDAIRKAMLNTEKGEDEQLLHKIASKIAASGKSQSTVDEIQNMVELELMRSSRKDVAKEYISYRNKRDIARKAKTSDVFMDIINAKNNDITRENANMNADTPAGMMMKFASETSKEFATDYLMSEKTRNALEHNYIHVHDLDYMPTRSLTCLASDTNIRLKKKGGETIETTLSYFDSYYGDKAVTSTEPDILDIEDGIEIMGRYGWTRVVNVSRRLLSAEDKFFCVKTNEDKHLKATGTHRIPVIDADSRKEELKFVSDIKLGDYFLLSDQRGRELIVRMFELDKENVVVWDIETEEHWFEANGYIVHNCVQHPLDNILTNGFYAGHGSSRSAKRIETAAALACISMETAQNEMHGGQAIPAFDFYMAPYVRMAYKEELKKAGDTIGADLSAYYDAPLKEYETKPLDGLVGTERALQMAMNETVKRVHQAMEAFIHNMNSIHSRGGNQVVFSSINYGTDTSAEGRCVMREILSSTYRGVGNGETAIFPIQIWKKKRGVNYLPEDPNYDLYQLACKVTARRFFPNFLNLDASYNQDPEWKADDPKRYEHEVATMGCRTRVFENRFGPKTSIGRGNLSFTTINIVKLAIECMDIENEQDRIEMFFSKLDEMLEIAAEQLDDRYQFQKEAMAKQFPLLMKYLWIGADKLKPEDKVEEVINQGTLGIGFIGLAECLVALIGKHHGESEKAQELGLRIVTYMRDRINDFCERYHHNYSVLATPAEGLSGKFTKKDKKLFGIIHGVTDRDYYTNSSHVPVYYKCTARHKAEVEAPYHKLERGGHIFYVEIDGDATHNPQVIMRIVDMMDDLDMGYGSVNHNRNRCMDCGYENADPNITSCPHCGSTNIDKLQRITG